MAPEVLATGVLKKLMAGLARTKESYSPTGKEK